MLDDPRLRDLFWKQVSPEPNTGCWLWTGSTTPDGYGLYGNYKTGSVLAHVRAYKTLVGEYAEPTLDHMCETKSCVNPAHLLPRSVWDNARRGSGPTAKNARKTECGVCGGSFETATYGRVCRPCSRRRAKEHKLRKKNNVT